MSICKTSSYGENRSTLRRSSQLEENILQKNLSLLRSMRRQYESRFGLESKAITRRITNSLERSAQIDTRVMSMKCSMAPSNRRHYRIKDHSTAEILKDAWNNDDSKARISAMICTVILPIAVRLLEEQGMAVSKEVRLQLEDLQKAHRHYIKRPNSLKKKRSKSLGDRPTSVQSEDLLINKSSKISVDSPSRSNPLISNSYITTSDLELDESSAQPRTTRSHTVQYIGIDPPARIGRGKPRPLSAPGILNTYQPLRNGADRVPSRICEEGSNPINAQKRPIYLEISSESPVTEKPGESIQNNDKVRQVLPDDRDPDESTIDSECSLRKLHAKVHTSLESVTLVDVHKALVTTKNYPNRRENFLRCIQKWKIPAENDAEDHPTSHPVTVHSSEVKDTTAKG